MAPCATDLFSLQGTSGIFSSMIVARNIINYMKIKHSVGSIDCFGSIF